MTTEFFWRIDKSKWWEIPCSDCKQWNQHNILQPECILRKHWFIPFDEVADSKAPHLVINRPHYDRDPSVGVQYSSGCHILIPQEVLGLLLVWQLSPGFGEYKSCREFLDANYQFS